MISTQRALVALVFGLLIAAGCRSTGSQSLATFKMGEKVQLGPLVYNITEAEWRAELGADADRRVPANRFLVIRLSITNGGGSDAYVPLLSLIDKDGKEYMELSEVKGVSDWMGVLRQINPAGTEDGRIVFDVPAGPYKLRLTDGGRPGEERLAAVEIPLQLGPGGQTYSGGQATP